MKYLAFLLLSTALWMTSCNKESLVPANTQLTDISDVNTFNSELATGVSIVFFHATWCSKCAAQRPAVENLVGKPEFKDVYFGQVDYEKNTNIVKQADVTGFPTILIFKDGVEKARYEGTGHSQSKLESKLKELL